jgi:peptidoglycan/LPS O-acetylase OafA/YrhL
VNARADRFPLFDSLRAVAALSVLAFHASFISRVFTSGSFVEPYASHLDVGVTVFFLISGFLLYRPFVRARVRGDRSPHVPAYAWRRFLRIAPAYWVALTAIAVWFGLSYVFTSSGVPIYYGFAQVYFADKAPGGIPQAWTLCVEVTFYAFLPLWALAMRRLGGRRVVRRELVALALLWAASLAYKAWALTKTGPTDLASSRYLQTLPNFLDQFAIGMGLAVLSVHWEREDRLPRAIQYLRRHDWLPWLLSIVAFWVVSTRIGFTGYLLQHYSRRMFVGRHELYTLVALGLVLPAALAEPGRGVAGRLLASRALAFLGLISYGLYLYHLAVIKQLDLWLGSPLDVPLGIRIAVYAALGVLGAGLLAGLSYYLVERPALRLRRLVSVPTPAERGEATAEPAPALPSTTPTSTASATSAGWRKRGTP